MLPSRAHGEMDGRREMNEKTLLAERETTPPELFIPARAVAQQGPHSFVSWLGVNVCDIGNVWANPMNQTLFLSKRQQKKQ